MRRAEEADAVLDGRRVIAVGFAPAAGAEVVKTFQAAGAFAREMTPSMQGAPGRSCDLVVAWLPGLEEHASLPGPPTAPLIAAVAAESAVEYLPWIRESAMDCIVYPCSEKEMLVRAVLAMERNRTRRTMSRPRRPEPCHCRESTSRRNRRTTSA